jgi:GrpB-like predicted nucleotidyltransferase (UPF0157 family)
MNKDQKLLAEAYTKVYENYWDPEKVPFPRPEAKYVDMPDGTTKLDLYATGDKDALWYHISNTPKLRRIYDELVDKRDDRTFSRWLDSLDKEIISNGNQKAAAQEMFKDSVIAKYPQAKDDYEKLKRQANLPDFERHKK